MKGDLDLEPRPPGTEALFSEPPQGLREKAASIYPCKEMAAAPAFMHPVLSLTPHTSSLHLYNVELSIAWNK